MIRCGFDYVAPDTIEEAVAKLAGSEKAVVLAGGLSLLTAMKQGRMAPVLMIDLRKLPALRGITRGADDGGLRIGAMATCAEIAADPEVRRHHPALTDAIDSISDPQVRNRATLGGNLCSGDPAADGPPVALALKSVMQVAGPNGQRAIAADEFYATASHTALGHGEIVTDVEFPGLAGAGAAYLKIKNPASGYPICGVAALMAQGADGSIGECRVTVTGVGRPAARLTRVEAAVQGQKPSKDLFAAAAQSVLDENLSFTSDLAASAEYRVHLTRVLAEQALVGAYNRLRAFHSRTG